MLEGMIRGFSYAQDEDAELPDEPTQDEAVEATEHSLEGMEEHRLTDEENLAHAIEARYGLRPLPELVRFWLDDMRMAGANMDDYVDALNLDSLDSIYQWADI